MSIRKIKTGKKFKIVDTPQELDKCMMCSL